MFHSKTQRIIVLSLCLSAFLGSIILIAQAQNKDAISIRVLPNPNKYSAARWYKEYFKKPGSPQSVIVDGYRGVRDGRTVYVNAANAANTSSLFTNIFVITYNLEAGKSTEDIFSQILKNWKFNSNIAQDPAKDKCAANQGINCTRTDECPLGDYCLSLQAEVRRDVRRMEDVADIKYALDAYFQKTGHYPMLDAGTYIQKKTLSVWPSWQATLAKEIGVSLPVDPVNIVGDCSGSGFEGYDPVTCWNEETKLFNQNATFTLPNNSQLYVYQSVRGGQGYRLDAIVESNYVENCVIGGEAASLCIFQASPQSVPASVNNAPEIDSLPLPNAMTKQEYLGQFKVKDADGDKVTVQIIPTMGSWSSWVGGPSLHDGVQGAKTIYAEKAGSVGDYYIDIVLDDGNDLPNSIVFYKANKISVVTTKPTIIGPSSINLLASSTKQLNITGWQAVDNIAAYDLVLESASLPDGLAGNLVEANNKFDFFISGALTPSALSGASVSGSFVIKNHDNASEIKEITFNISNTAPSISSYSCPSVRGGCGFSCQAGAITDPEGNDAIYELAPATAPGFTIDPATGLISNSAVSAGTHNISVRAKDEFGLIGAVTNAVVITKTFCGDGVKQTLNSDNESEQCDGAGGSGFSASDQYACTAGCQDCAGSSCTSGCQWTGGWLGDGVINGPELCDPGKPAASPPVLKNLGGKTCQDFGFNNGDLSCKADGTFDIADCFTTKVEVCVGNPLNSHWNMVSSITQTLFGSVWLPTNVGSYETSPSSVTCNFVCDSGFVWNGSACVLPCCSFGSTALPCSVCN